MGHPEWTWSKDALDLEKILLLENII